MLAKCSAPFENRTRRVLICGPKSSGKSTFAKLLVNKLLSTSLEMTKSTSNERHSGVALMDIDPGQPEYCPPGQLALVHVQEPNFGPPFAHPMPGPKSKIIRSHSIGAVSPSLDPELYMSCALDLFAHYKKLLAQLPNCPLVINTPGWVLGTGLEILVDLIANIRPTEVIYMSKDGPPEVVESLAEVAVAIPVLTLPSQSSEYTTRTAAHLRTMQYMSYFHIDPLQENHAAWMPQPLTTMRPWEIRYTGQNPGIKGIICYGEQPPPSLVAETINGSLVSVVVLDDMTAIPGWHQGKGHEPFERETDERVSGSNARYAQPAIIDSACVDLPPKLQSPLIVRTPEDIPYFNPGNSITLDPSTSQSIGLALVRGIDRERHQIQILTPIHPGVINDINKSGKAIVLVSGKLDTPGWAYIEELNQKMALEKPQKQNDVDASVGDGVEVEEASEDNDASDMQMTMVESLKDAPWIEKLQGSEGRGVGSRVWRVRRDLGRADGGD
jgi:polynucleotide 5'-hydroxyl-kinase GRC3/NOL9